MENEAPADLRSEIRVAGMPIRESLRKSGWQVGIIHWKDKSSRTVSFTAKSPSGKAASVTCKESELPEKLKTLLKSGSPSTEAAADPR
jgi:hypothetical protein